MNKLILAIVLFSGLLSVKARLPDHWKNNDRLQSAEIPGFQCRKAGQFQHPYSCTKFITCSQQLVAIERDCPPCTDESRCLDTALHYNDEKKTCQLPRSDFCPHKPTTTTTTPTPPPTTTSTTTTTTPQPTTTITTTTPTTTTTTTPPPTTTTTTTPPPTTTTTTTPPPTTTITTTTPPTTTITTTTPPTTTITTTTPPPTTTVTTTTNTPPPTTIPKKPCKPNCTITGFCACYDICIEDPSSPEGGYYFKQWCDYELYWNPDAASSSAHGGSCDFWTNLSPELQAIYRKDPKDCPTPPEPCEWKADDKCDNKYYYRPEATVYVEFQHLQCPRSPASQPPLYWNQDTKTCGFDCPKGPNKCKFCP